MSSPIPNPPTPPPWPNGPGLSDDVGWQISSFCAQGGCVEVKYVSSSSCGTGSCVEVGQDGDRVLVRDSKLDDSPVLSYSLDEWWAFVVDVRGGVLPSSAFEQVLGGGVDLVRLVGEDLVRLEFDKDEWSAFVEGVKAREFDFHTQEPAPSRGMAGADEAAGRDGHRAAACVTGEDETAISSPVAPRVASMNGGSSLMDSPAGRGPEAVPPVAAEGPIRADQPGLDPIGTALVELALPDLDPWDSHEAYGRRCAIAAYNVGVRAGFAQARAGDGVPAWRSGPLTQHVPVLNDFEDSPVSTPGEAPATSGVGAGVEVAPVPVGGPAGATDPGVTLADVYMARAERDEILP